MTENDLIALAAAGKCNVEMDDSASDYGDEMLTDSDVELDVEDGDGGGDVELTNSDVELTNSDVELTDSDVELDAADGDGDEDVELAAGEDDDDLEFEPEDDADEVDITDEAGDALKPKGDDGTLPPVAEGREQLAAKPQPKGPVSLRSNNIARSVTPTVDREKNAIRNVSVMQAGPAMGHGFMIDKTMLDQVRQQMKGGVPMRYTHPQKVSGDGQVELTDPLGTHVGRVTNVREGEGGDELRGDIEFGPHAKHVPMLGNVADYLMDLAEHDPSAFGLSTVFMPDDYGRDALGNLVGRSAGVAACDLTGDPASNRRGLL
jgi:hypothetical protein